MTNYKKWLTKLFDVKKCLMSNVAKMCNYMEFGE